MLVSSLWALPSWAQAEESFDFDSGITVIPTVHLACEGGQRLVPSDAQATVPSLWATRQVIESQPRFRLEVAERGPRIYRKLVDEWRLDTGSRSVYLVVNPQRWSLLDYLERYEFITEFGQAAAEDNHSIRICDRRNATLAEYVCTAPQVPALPPIATGQPPDVDPVGECKVSFGALGSNVSWGDF